MMRQLQYKYKDWSYYMWKNDLSQFMFEIGDFRSGWWDDEEEAHMNARHYFDVHND